MFTVELLPAKYGDAILVTYGVPGDPHHVLVDAGLGSVAKTVTARVAELAHIDLFVVSHVDTDHIGGAVKLLGDPSFTSRLGGVWFNGYAQLVEFSDLLGPLDGERLTTRILEQRIPWNQGWAWRHHPDPAVAGAGGAVVVEPDRPLPRVELPGGAVLTLVSPYPDKLRRLHAVWSKVIRKGGLVDGVRPAAEPAQPPGLTMLGDTLEDLAGSPTDDDGAEANGSSIAFVLEYQDGPHERRVLLGADAHPDALVTSLTALRGADARYHVDACKLPHHGSRANVSQDLVAALDCRRWLVSSNGVRFSHPNPEALARVVVGGGPSPRIYGNYASAFLTGFAAQFPPGDHGYEMVLPAAGAPDGITLAFDDEM